jgi:hypothetical protein
VQHAERTERVGWRGAGRFCVQRGTPQKEGTRILTPKHWGFNARTESRRAPNRPRRAPA